MGAASRLGNQRMSDRSPAGGASSAEGHPEKQEKKSSVCTEQAVEGATDQGEGVDASATQAERGRLRASMVARSQEAAWQRWDERGSLRDFAQLWSFEPSTLGDTARALLLIESWDSGEAPQLRALVEGLNDPAALDAFRRFYMAHLTRDLPHVTT